jgi:hypothetical protein
MASSISAGTTSGTALVATADTSGALVLQTNNGTTALTLSTAQNATFAGTLTTAAQGIAKASLPAGSVLQVVSTIKQDTFSMSGGSFVAITGLSASITPTSTSNKVLVQVSMGRIGPNIGTGATVAFQILRNSTVVGAGTPAGSQIATSFVTVSSTNGNYSSGGFAFQFLDSPSSTSSITYSVQILGESSVTVYINRSYTGGTGSTVYEAASASTITATEIAA